MTAIDICSMMHVITEKARNAPVGDTDTAQIRTYQSQWLHVLKQYLIVAS